MGPALEERGYRSFLTLSAILGEARAIADSEGLAAVSMRALADRLGCTPRALYRHVAGKEEVLELVADAALGEVPLVRADLDWPDALVEFFTAMHHLLVTYPAVGEIVTRHAVAGPHFRAHADALVRRLLAAGFEADIAVEAIVALAQFTVGAATPGTGQALHEAYRGLDPALTGGPGVAQVRRHLVQSSAADRFAAALRRLVGAYG